MFLLLLLFLLFLLKIAQMLFPEVGHELPLNLADLILGTVEAFGWDAKLTRDTVADEF